MKHIFFALTAALLLPLTGCVTQHSLRMAGTNYVPNDPQNVLILDEPPKWRYSEIGYVQAQAGPFISDVELYHKLQVAAGEIGADAVIPEISFEDYKGRSEDEFVSRVIKGTAIVRVR